jgi:Fic family protein
VDVIYNLIQKERISEEDLYTLHRCVMQKSAIDALRPIGAWKRDYNGATGVIEGKTDYMEYASPLDTPFLMKRWLKEFNRKSASATSHTKAVNVYAWSHLTFVRIHPFFDGNGRLARLIANLPLLRGGFPPLLISPERRSNYIDLLWEYEHAVGVIKRNDRLLPPHPNLNRFKEMLKEEWLESFELVEQAKERAETRKDAE